MNDRELLIDDSEIAGRRKACPAARLLRAAVGFALVPTDQPELRLLHRWLDSWRGVGGRDHPAISQISVRVVRTQPVQTLRALHTVYDLRVYTTPSRYAATAAVPTAAAVMRRGNERRREG
jgi:hypothetical protein